MSTVAEFKSGIMRIPHVYWVLKPLTTVAKIAFKKTMANPLLCYNTPRRVIK